MNALRPDLNYERPVAIAEGVYWVGFFDPNAGFHCNPYLIIDGEEALLIDGGSRPDFPTVMMKILQTGIQPSQIKGLVYQHNDPDLCGSVYHFEDLIGRKDLQLISSREESVFIRYYGIKAPIQSIEDIGYSYTFSSGRRLRFLMTPFAHSTGSFITFDEQTGILFTSDLFGSYSNNWHLFQKISPACRSCETVGNCPGGQECILHSIVEFHRRIITSEKALRYALRQVASVPYTMIAPQHGSVLHAEDASFVLDRLASLEGVGIDGIFA